MNLPNKLTVLRVILIPVFIVFLMGEVAGDASCWIALGVFCIASVTDCLDGMIARKYNLITNFGKFMDPLADKLLVSSALICFIELGLLPSWFVIVIISREFIISGFRLVASDNGLVIAASFWGKIKTVFQMAMTIFFIVLYGIKPACYLWDNFMLVDYSGGILKVSVLTVIATALAWISLILTVISLIDYIIKNKDIMKDKK